MSETSPAQRNRPIQDLREWLERVEQIGELITVTKPVERDEEMSAIGYLLAKQKPSPAVLFTKTTGFEKSKVGMRHLWNVLGPSVRRIAVTLEEHPDTPTVELIRRTKDKLKRRTPPREVPRKEAQFFENSWTGDSIDLEKLPIPKHWPRDGGRYAGTADCVITQGPRDRLPQRRHLPHDDPGQEHGRALLFARQGRAAAHPEGVGCGQADRGGGVLGRRSAVHAGRLADVPQDACRNTSTRAASRASRSR